MLRPSFGTISMAYRGRWINNKLYSFTVINPCLMIDFCINLETTPLYPTSIPLERSGQEKSQ